MSFKKALNAHREKVGAEEAAIALAAASRDSARELRLRAVIEELAARVVPLFDQFVAEATEEGHYADTRFQQEDWRCWWSVDFIAKKGEEVSHDLQRGANVNSALVRAYPTGEVSLELHLRRGHESRLTRDQREVRSSIDAVTSERLEAWLDEFVRLTLELQRQDEAEGRRL